jgi:formate hydrogenlyase subunit 6/NADH:ubiquinone oxidoreductase subunit I
VIQYRLDRCIFCAQCVESCRFNCLELNAGKWELAALSPEAFVFHYGEADDIAEALRMQENDEEA